MDNCEHLLVQKAPRSVSEYHKVSLPKSVMTSISPWLARYHGVAGLVYLGLLSTEKQVEYSPTVDVLFSVH